MTELTQQRKEQELFERTISDNNPSRIDLEMVLPGVYVNKQVQAAWEGWQAGRSSAESENERLREAVIEHFGHCRCDQMFPKSRPCLFCLAKGAS